MEEERGVSLTEIFKVIFKKVWWLLGVVTAGILFFVLVVQFAYNPKQQYYSVSFSIDYPEVSSGLYPDGTVFRYTDIINIDTLSYVKGLNDDYSGISVDKMSGEGSISITETKDESSTVYTLTVPKKYFSSTKQAASFLRDLTDMPVKYVKSSAQNIDHAAYLSAYNNSSTYALKISFLDSEYNYIIDKYKSYIARYGDTFNVNGRSLATYVSALNAAYSSDMTSKLNSELENGGYLYDQDTLEAENKVLNEEKKNVEAILAKLLDQFNGLYGSGSTTAPTAGTQLDASITTYTVRLAQIENTLSARQSEDYVTKNAIFGDKIDSYKTKLDEQAEILKTVSSSLYASQSRTVYATNKIEATGGINIIVAAVVGAVLSFIIASIVICAIDMPKYIKKRDSEAITAGASSEKNK